MNYLPFSSPFRKGLQVVLLLAILLFNFGASVAHAAPPLNDNFANATVVGFIAFSETVNTTEATVEPNDPNNFGPCDGTNLVQGYKSIWYKYTAPTKGIIAADTIGTDPYPINSYDTYISVWTGNSLTSLTFVACDDSVEASQDAQVTWRAKAGITYYVEVAQYKCTTAPGCINEPITTVPTLTFHMVIGGGDDTTGVFRPSNGALYLKNQNTTGVADIQINYGIPNDYPIVGDWDGNGTVTIGVYRNGVFYLRNYNTIGIADVYFPFGSPGDQPVAGDWDGDGTDTIGD